MSTPKASRVTLDLEAGGDPIRGSIEHADGSRTSFWGWLELMDELRRVAADVRERAPPGQPRREPSQDPGPRQRARHHQQPSNTEDRS